MSVVVLTGSAGALGRRVAAGLVESGSFDRVVGLDSLAAEAPARGWIQRRVDLLVDDLDPHFEGADVVIHLASVVGPQRDQAGDGLDVELTRRVLDAAGRAGVGRVVVMSSATAYGARVDNPIPMTEDAPLDPNPGFAFAAEKVEIEKLANAYAAEHPSAKVAILRPTTTLAEGEASWVAAALTAAVGVRAGEIDPPVQFLHFDDLASATVLVAERGSEGAFNVAPDGWIPPDQIRALAGLPRPRVPARVARILAGLRWRLGLSLAPPQVLPWVMHPWVVANDRLRSEGWIPSYTNEEAYVAGTAPGPLDTLSPKRRQELALGAVGMLGLLGVVGAVLGIRRMRRR